MERSKRSHPTEADWLQDLNQHVCVFHFYHYLDLNRFLELIERCEEKPHAGGPCTELNLLLDNPQHFYYKKRGGGIHNIPEGLIKKACSQKALLLCACGTAVSTSSRKTRKVTFLPRVATSVPSLVRSWRPLGARLGHFCRLGLNLRGAPSVQLFDKALRYLEFSPEKGRKR